MYPLSNNRIPNRDLNYVNPLLDSVSNRSEAAGEKVLKLIQDLKATFIDQKQSYQENSGQYKDLKNRFNDNSSSSVNPKNLILFFRLYFALSKWSSIFISEDSGSKEVKYNVWRLLV